MNQTDPVSLLNTIYSKNEAAAFIYELESLKEAMYQTNTTLSKKIKKSISANNLQPFLRYFKKNPGFVKDPNSLKLFIEQIKKMIEQIPTITIMITSDPTKELKKKITQLMMKMLSRKVFIDYEKQPLIIGGAAIICKGKYHDFSISNYLETLYQKYL